MDARGALRGRRREPPPAARRPGERVSTHRAVDYWGRQLVDQLIGKLPSALAPEGVAYVMHLSLLSQQRTAELLDAAGFRAAVVDWSMFEHAAAARGHAHADRARRGAQRRLPPGVGERDVVVAYLLEVTAKASGNGRGIGPGGRGPSL